MHGMAIVAALMLATAPQPAARTGPQLPYFDWGACPLEGCTYQKWQASRPVTVWAHRDRKSPVAYGVRTGEWVEALTGVVITYDRGVSKVLAPLTLGQGASVAVVPGDILWILHYGGEDYDLFWFKGKTYEDQIASDKPDPDPPPPELKIQVISRPRSVWWVKVKNSKGQVGWTDQARNVSHVSVLE